MPRRSPDPDLSTSPESPEGNEGTSMVGGEVGDSGAEPVERRPDGSLTSYGARMLRQRSAASQRERNADAAEEARLSHLTARQRLGLSLSKLSQADMDEVVQSLARRAKTGDEKAVNALARLLDQSFGRSGTEPVADPRPTTEKPWEEWTEAEKAQYRSALLAERDRLQAEAEAAGDATDPRAVPDPDTPST